MPSVQETSACVSPRVNRAEPCDRGSSHLAFNWANLIKSPPIRPLAFQQQFTGLRPLHLFENPFDLRQCRAGFLICRRAYAATVCMAISFSSHPLAFLANLIRLSIQTGGLLGYLADYLFTPVQLKSLFPVHTWPPVHLSNRTPDRHLMPRQSPQLPGRPNLLCIHLNHVCRLTTAGQDNQIKVALFRSSYVGKYTGLPSTRLRRQAPSGPINGTLLIDSAALEAIIASTSGSYSGSALSTIDIICTSLKYPSGNNGRIGRSIIRASKFLLCSVGLLV